MSTDASRLERWLSIGVGAPLVLLAASLLGWGVRLAMAGVRTDAGWPPGLEKLLLPIALTAVFVGFGAWRLLLLGLPQGIRGFSCGRLILAAFALAAVAGLAF